MPRETTCRVCNSPRSEERAWSENDPSLCAVCEDTVDALMEFAAAVPGSLPVAQKRLIREMKDRLAQEGQHVDAA